MDGNFTTLYPSACLCTSAIRTTAAHENSYCMGNAPIVPAGLACTEYLNFSCPVVLTLEMIAFHNLETFDSLKSTVQ